MRRLGMYKGDFEWRMTRKGKMKILKKRILNRLNHEDYSNRLSLDKPMWRPLKKPRVRYRLTLQYHPVHCGFWQYGVMRVYK